MAEYYTKVVINPNSIIVETSIGSSRYYETVPRSSEEDLALANVALAHKALACSILNVDANQSFKTSRIARTALAPDLTE